MRSCPPWALAVLAVVATGLAWLAVGAIRESGFGATLDRARAEVKRGRFADARRSLATLPDWRWRGDPEAAHLVGLAEHAAGRFEAALGAWSAIPGGSPRAIPAALARARTLVGDLGRVAEAESVLEAALAAAPAGQGRLEIRHTLSQLDFLGSRPEAMRKLIREGRADWRDPAAELRDLWLIDDATVMVDEVRQSVDAWAALSPDDDRVRLARAGLAWREGRLDEARAQVDACLARRPGDEAALLLRLKVARSSADAAGVRSTLPLLGAGTLPEADLLDLRAWLAATRGDSGDERRSLERRVAIGPADPRALERLAVLAWEAGDRDRAADLRRRKGGLDAAKDRYRRLLVDPASPGNHAELAALAEALDRPFEAQGWWALVRSRAPDDPEARAGLARLGSRPEGSSPLPASGTLADRLASLLPATPGPVAARPGLGLPSAPPPSDVRFVDAAENSGLRFTLEVGRSFEAQLPETTAGGVAVLDYDGDGWLDVYALQAGTFPPGPSHPHGGDRLFRNRGDGTFIDATGASGLAAMPRGFGHGVAVGDVDNDGRPDLLVTRWRSYALYRNNGDGTFADATEPWGLGGDRGWPTSAAFADLDGDGDLDLYVCHYAEWDADHPTLCPRTSTDGRPIDPSKRYGYCMPHGLVASPDHLFRNDGGRFVDISAESGIAAIDRDGRGLGVVAADVDDDGRVDLFVANDTTANYLLMNRGGLRFADEGAPSGVACNAEGAFQAGMGVAAGDLDGDGRLDLAVTNFYGESTTCYRNLGGGTFADATASIGLGSSSRYLLGFGIAFLDADDDGRLDLATANGHVNDDRPKYPYAMPAQLLLGVGGGRLKDASARAGPSWTIPRIGRGLAVADLDDDGKLDLLIVGQGGPLAYLHNQSEAGRSLTLRLEGTASNRDAVGARVVATVGGRKLLAYRAGGGSFQSASDGRVHIGLGPAPRVDDLEVRWPSGRVDRFRDLAAGSGLHLVEGDPAPRPLPGFPPPPADRP